MEDEQLAELECKNPEKAKHILDNFNKKNADLFNFSKFRTNQWHTLWKVVFSYLNDAAMCDLHSICLNTIRILTRDDASLQKHDIGKDLNCLFKLSHLTLPKVNVMDPHFIAEQFSEVGATTLATTVDTDTNIIVETLKCLCNLVFQSPECRRECVKSNVTDAILKRVCSPTVYPSAVELYDMKLLFLITALDSAARNRVQIDSNGIAYMTEWLDEKLGDSDYSDEQLDVLCEMLKVMFNITTSPDKSPNESEIQNLHLTGVIRELLLRFGAMNVVRQRNVVAHAINLLTNMSSASLMELMVKCEPDCASVTRGDITTGDTTDTTYSSVVAVKISSDPLIFEGWNVRVLDILLRYLGTILEEQGNAASGNELLPPVLTVLVKCARCHRTMRHFIRSVVLPPLRDVSKRPEVGNELRNHLCRFLTLPTMGVRDLAAELLFVCCKENAARMVKYTGYGNAAGLFAKRGLLDCRRVETADYSSESEDSDTEEYKQLAHDINPVVGCYEPPKRSPLEDMSEEQKEYEAVQLANLMHKLHRSGIVQPCLIGEDGKPQPVDHILQLQEELPQQQLDQKQKS